MGIRNLCELLNCVKELIVFECLKKSGVTSRHRFKADCYQKATSKTKKAFRELMKNLFLSQVHLSF